MQIILASASPRRKELLSKIGMEFKVIVSEVDETLEKNLTIEEQSKKLAYKKALAVFEKTTGERVVIGADTMVFKDNKIYGKPKNKEEAYKMLEDLQGSMHKVISSLCVLIQKEGEYKKYIEYDISEVYIKKMSEQEILKWIEAGKPFDKAGGYAIQENFMVFVNKINGNYETIVGLPISKLYDILKDNKIIK